MDLLHLVTRLEELVSESQKMPIGNRIITDRRKLLDVIDQMRVVIPQEVREAQAIVQRDDELRRQAEEESRIIVARAEEQARLLIDEHGVTTAAHANARHLEQNANSRLEERIETANVDIQFRIDDSRRAAERQMTDADAYSAELLRRLERQLEAFVRSVRAGLSQLEPEPAGDLDSFELPVQPAAADQRTEIRNEIDAPSAVEPGSEEVRVPVGAGAVSIAASVAATATEPVADPIAEARAIVKPAPLPEVTPIPIRFDAMSSIEDVEESAEPSDEQYTADDALDSDALAVDEVATDDDSVGDDMDDGEPEGELENLLARPSIPGMIAAPQAEADADAVTLIDDLAEPWLDDEGRKRSD